MGMALPTLTISILVLTSAIYKFIIYPTFLSPLSKIPNAHPTAPFSSVWSLYIRYFQIENATLLRLHRARGPIIRLGPNEISVNCYEEGVKTVYGGNFDKTDFYPRRFANYGGVTNMLSIKAGKEHAARKRMLANIYSKSQIMTSRNVQAATTRTIFERFLPIFTANAGDDGEAIDILSLSYAYSIDSFMAYQFGPELGSNFLQDLKVREWYLRNFLGRRPYLFWTIEAPTLLALLQRLGFKIIPNWFYKGIQEIEAWNLRICDEAEKLLVVQAEEKMDGEQPAVFEAMRDAMLKADAKVEKPTQLSEEQQLCSHRMAIASEMLDHNAAALETSGVTLTYIFYHLSLRPALQAQLRKELLALTSPILSPSDSSNSGKSLPSAKELDALPLLDAIILETLRLYAPAPGPQPRVTPYLPCKLAGMNDIPGGIRVSASAWCLHRNGDVFPDPEEWKPERWMIEDEERVREMRRWFWAFGSGGRMCIGSHFAINSMKYAVAAVYTGFESWVVDASGMEQTDGYTTGPRAEKVMLGFRRVD